MATNLSDDYNQNLIRHCRMAFIEIIAEYPKMTIEELRSLLIETPGAGSLTLEEVLLPSESVSTSTRASRKRAKGVSPTDRAQKGEPKARNVRTEEGRQAFDLEVLAALAECGGQDVSATDVRVALGADAHQLRTSLNRLISEGKVSYTGKARGTKYSVS